MFIDAVLLLGSLGDALLPQNHQVVFDASRFHTNRDGRALALPTEGESFTFAVYGDRTGGMKGYNDDTVHGTVAAFLLMRGQHWLFSIGPNGGGGGESYPPYANKPGYLLPATAEVLTSDFGKPLNAMSAVAGKANVFQREFEKATVTLDCNDFSGTFLLKHI